MPKKKSAPKRELATLLAEVPLKPQVHKFSYEERQELQQLFTHPLFVRAWQNMLLSAPTLFPPTAFDGQFGPQQGNNRLHELRGFNLCKFALLKSLEEPSLPKPKLTDNFPDAGTLEADVAQQLKQQENKK